MDKEKLIIETERILNQGWIKSLTNGAGSVGTTFEKLLNLENNDFEIPDYGDIEIKTKTKHTDGYITLFGATPDSYLFETKRLLKEYGFPSTKNPEFMVFRRTFYATKKTYMQPHVYGKLKIDRQQKKIFLQIMNENNKIYEQYTSWSFELLEEKLNRKLKKLLLVYAKKRYFNNQIYFKYISYHYYLLKDFNSFLKAIENGFIQITFKIGVYHSGIKAGKMRDHGTSLDIDINKIDSLFLLIKEKKTR